MNRERVKAEAFLPYPRRETSVFQTRGLTSDRVWGLAKLARTDKQVQGRADFTETDLASPVDLRFLLDDKPPRHGNLIDWPAEKDAQKEIALELAARAKPLLTDTD